MRHFVIGDIHGHIRALDSVLSAVDIGRGDRLTFLGDYIDHGPNSRAVLDCVIGLTQELDVTALRGNHEAFLLGSLEDKDVDYHWRNYGAGATLASFAASSAADIPQSYIDWMGACPLWAETQEYIFAHAGVNPAVAVEKQSVETLLWSHLNTPISHYSGKTLVCGHTPRLAPMITKTCIGLDTGIARGGWLSCLELNSKSLFQSDMLGALRINGQDM